MKCPYCSREMEIGYIQSRDGLGWSVKKRIVNALSGLLAEQDLGKTVTANRCNECKKIVINYADEEDK